MPRTDPSPSWCRRLCLAVCLALGACAAPQQGRVTSAAKTPLSDLNLLQLPIPAVLLAAQAKPYRLPANQQCASVNQELRSLDEPLGPDLDVPDDSADSSLADRGNSAAQYDAIGALHCTAEGVIPFRGWIRKLSGAERYSRQIAAARRAGTARRAFLKGLNAAHGCG